MTHQHLGFVVVMFGGIFATFIGCAVAIFTAMKTAHRTKRRN
jgi:hypothetical protein